MKGMFNLAHLNTCYILLNCTHAATHLVNRIVINLISNIFTVSYFKQHSSEEISSFALSGSLVKTVTSVFLGPGSPSV